MKGNSIHILICDDDIHFCESLKKQISNISSDYIVKETYSVDEANSYIQKNNGCIDAVFLDIEFETAPDGIILGETLQKQFPEISIVFITAHAYYCDKIFKAQPTSFLLKPIDEFRLREALEMIETKPILNSQYISVQTINREMYTIICNEIIYIESRNHNVDFHLTDGSVITSRIKINQIINSLPNTYIRCHQSFLINPIHISNYSGGEFTMRNGYRIRCSNYYLTSARGQFIEFCSNTVCKRSLYI